MITLTKAQRENALATFKPIEIARLLYEHWGMDAAKFAEDLWEHLSNAFVVSTPRMFVMGRAVMLEDGRHAWLVNMLVGPLEDLAQHLPFPLECIAFGRNGDMTKLKVYPFARWMKHIKGKIWEHQLYHSPPNGI